LPDEEQSHLMMQAEKWIVYREIVASEPLQQVAAKNK
jgi:hypothetical protein